MNLLTHLDCMIGEMIERHRAGLRVDYAVGHALVPSPHGQMTPGYLVSMIAPSLVISEMIASVVTIPVIVPGDVQTEKIVIDGINDLRAQRAKMTMQANGDTSD